MPRACNATFPRSSFMVGSVHTGKRVFSCILLSLMNVPPRHQATGSSTMPLGCFIRVIDLFLSSQPDSAISDLSWGPVSRAYRSHHCNDHRPGLMNLWHSESHVWLYVPLWTQKTIRLLLDFDKTARSLLPPRLGLCSPHKISPHHRQIATNNLHTAADVDS